MKNKLYILFIILSSSIFAKNLSDIEAKSFIKALISNSNNLEEFVDTTELQLSKRLGVSYPNSENKFLIANNISSSIREKLLSDKLKYHYNIKNLEKNYSLLIVEIPDLKLKYEYFFYNSKLISKPAYYAKNWKIISSKYFVFHVSDTNLINDYSISDLNVFVENMMSILEFTTDEIKRMEKEKIHYFLCKDEFEIKQLTNYSARGLYFIAFDYIISIFSNHYHEISHLLINYKLNEIELYTLPILQEGFAVAYGGRGGKTPNIILNMGAFLIRSKFLDYTELLDKNSFYQFNASISYPVAGLYVKFLIETIGLSNFLDLYRKKSNSSSQISSISISIDELPNNNKWDKFVASNSAKRVIQILNIDILHSISPTIKGNDYFIYEYEDEYIFKIKNLINIHVNDNIKNYSSKLFKELFPNDKYQNQKYAVIVNSDEISVYNFYTNNLIAKYVKTFSTDKKSVLQNNGFYIFSIKKDLFSEPIKKWLLF